MERRWAFAMLVVAVATATWLAIGSTGMSSTCTTFGDGVSSCTTERTRLIDTEGTGVLGVLAVPAALGGLVVVFAHRERVVLAAALALTALAVLGMMTIGLFLLPTVALAWMTYSTSARSAAK